MSYKTIAAILQSKEDTQRALDCAIPLAQNWGAHIIGIHAETIPVGYSAAVGFPDVAMIETASEAAEERTKDVETIFRERMNAAGQTMEWHNLRSFSGDGAYTGATIARTADLVIAGQRSPEWAAEDAPNVEGVLYEAGRPVLVVPYQGALPKTFKHILISWNGSREAARAAFDALPLMEDAQAVDVLVVDAADDDFTVSSAAALANALSRHGLAANVVRENSAGRNVDDVMRERIASSGADLLVLGAFSHSWLRQLLFGGVTRSVLTSMPIPCLMSR